MELATNITNNLASWFYSDDKRCTSIKDLTNNQILNIANEINGLFPDNKIVDITMPNLIVVGCQSSGKSTILNTFMSMDILPTGKTLTTRSPLDIRLHKLINSNQSWVEFGEYNDSGWKLDKKFMLTFPIPLQKELDSVRTHINIKTSEIAGNAMNISSTPIIINIYSPNVPDMSLVDLPGLIMIAQTDNGQPEDIKEQIENLVTSYIQKPKTIVLA